MALFEENLEKISQDASCYVPRSQELLHERILSMFITHLETEVVSSSLKKGRGLHNTLLRNTEIYQ